VRVAESRELWFAGREKILGDLARRTFTKNYPNALPASLSPEGSWNSGSNDTAGLVNLTAQKSLGLNSSLVLAEIVSKFETSVEVQLSDEGKQALIVAVSVAGMPCQSSCRERPSREA
jgi:hypothetical protein